MEDPEYQVVLEGRTLGPYDRRTIVGMRIRKTLGSDDVLLASDGARLTVADLIRKRPRDSAFQPNRSGSYSIVQATFPASVMEVEGKGYDLPPFQGEVEARVQGDVLRVAGRLRRGLQWKDDRIKLPLMAVEHARVRGSLVDLWLKAPEARKFQRLTLELFTPDSAGELVEFFPRATPWPWDDVVPRHGLQRQTLLWATVVGSAALVGAVLIWAVLRSAMR